MIAMDRAEKRRLERESLTTERLGGTENTDESLTMSANEPIPPERQVLFGGTRWRLSMDSIYSYWVGMLGCPVETQRKDQEEQRSAERKRKPNHGDSEARRAAQK